MEELAEGALKGALRVLGLVVRSLIWLTLEFCFEKIAWYVGWPVCRLVTLDRLPRENITERDHASSLTNFTVSMAGLASLIALGIIIAKLVGPD